MPVIGLDKDVKGYGLSSKYTTVAGLCPYPLDDETGFIDLLCRIGQRLGRKAVIFPCLDEWVFAVLKHRALLEEFFIFPFSGLETINELLDKNLLYRKCLEMGIPIPRTYFLDEQKPESVASEIEFPCILKPALQREFTNEFGEKVFRVETREDFLARCEQASRHPMLAQHIVGSSIDSFYSLCSYVDAGGHARGVFVGRKLEQYPPDFGTACLVDSRYEQRIVERGIEVLKQFGYHGISEVEFIYDDRDGDFKLLDVNTRVWKWIGLPMHCGVDLPWLAYSDAIGQSSSDAERQRDNVKWVYLKDYIALRRQSFGSPDATLTHDDWLKLVSASSGERIVDAVLAQDDPAPFVKMIESLFEQRPYYCAC